MASSLIPQALDALVSLFTSALPNIEVRDGTVLQNEERAGLYVGTNLDDSRFGAEQRWPGLGHAVRDEAFEVPCVLFVRSGDNVLKPVRDEVFGYLATVESTLRNNVNLGISTNSVRAQLLAYEYSQPQTPDGVVCRLDFIVNIEGRI
ncbi:MAG: hypothetical protein ACXVGE_13050 [Blastococcus sp.]